VIAVCKSLPKQLELDVGVAELSINASASPPVDIACNLCHVSLLGWSISLAETDDDELKR
jgi:hypothetical protein